ncbi:hypothetical protein [Reyranella sp.]|uniref:hypothetical protein n=1 Tax=Reyranella sp. TaxID=1929291 RepID=UPI003BAC6914
MWRSWFLLALAALAVMSGIGAARALTPISPEQLFCDANTIFVGRAIEASPARRRPDAQDANGVDLSVMVRRVIGRKKLSGGPTPILAPGDSIRAYARASVAPYSAVGRFDDEAGLAFVGPYDSVVPETDLVQAYKAEDFIYAAHLAPGVRSFVRTWPLSQEEWVRKTMASYARMGQPCSSRL